MATYEEWQLWDFDPIESALKTVLVETIANPGIQVNKSRESNSSQTPRVDIVLTTQAVQGQKYNLNPQTPTKFQPQNVWFYQLTLETVTNRTQPPATLHAQLVAQCRMALQFYKLAASSFSASSPLHTIIDTQEQPVTITQDDTGALDHTKLTFTGMLQIRDTAWREVLFPGPSEAPVAIDRPIVSGTPEVGQILTSSSGTWENNPTTFAYQWFYADTASPIPGANTNLLLLTPEFEGMNVKIYVTASNIIGTSDPIDSDPPTGPITAAP